MKSFTIAIITTIAVLLPCQVDAAVKLRTVLNEAHLAEQFSEKGAQDVALGQVKRSNKLLNVMP